MPAPIPWKQVLKSCPIIRTAEEKSRFCPIAGAGTGLSGLPREVGEFLGTADITDLYITGTLSKKYAEAAQKKNLSLKTKWFSSNDELISYLKDYLKENDVVLIKASNGMKLYEVAKALE